jgi:hypothetical protein
LRAPPYRGIDLREREIVIRNKVSIERLCKCHLAHYQHCLDALDAIDTLIGLITRGRCKLSDDELSPWAKISSIILSEIQPRDTEWISLK